MQVPSDLVAWEVYMLGFFDTQSSHTLNNIFGKLGKKKVNKEQN